MNDVHATRRRTEPNAPGAGRPGFMRAALCAAAAALMAASAHAGRLLAIGDSITAAQEWQRRAGEVLDWDVRSHCKGGIGILAMVDGDSTLKPLSAADVDGVDAVVLMGFYNERGSVMRPETRGTAADRYPAQNTFCGRLNHAVARVREELARAGNAACPVVLGAPHLYGKYPWIDCTAYEDGEQMLAAIREVAEANKLPLVDLLHKGGVDRSNWHVYQASSSPFNAAYLTADGAPNTGVNKPFASLAAAPDPARNKGRFITVKGARGCFRSDGAAWRPDGAPFIWNGDQLHMSRAGYRKIGEVIAREMARVVPGATTPEERAARAARSSDAAAFGFSPDATGRENAAALQRAFDAGGTVRVTRPGRYKIAGTVFIGDDTSLVCDNGVYFVKTDEGGKFAQVILNKGALTKTWNRNIEITGLHIVVNGMDHNDWKVFGLRGHLAFFYAKDVRINRFRCLDLGRGQYCIHVCTFEDLIVDDVRIFGWKDGVHLGRGRRFTIRNGVFDTGDDPIALNAHDYSSGNPELGWIENGVIENCHDLYNPTRAVGFFCRILAGAWCDWREGMTVQQGDSVVSEGRLYRVSMPVDGRTFVSKTRPTHRKGQKVLDGINWVWVQDEAVYDCGVRNVVFRDCYLEQPRTAFSVHYDFGKYSRSQYPGAKPPKQEGIVFDNIQVLYTNNVPFLSVATPVDSISLNNCSLRGGGIRFSANAAMSKYGYGRTQIQVNGCRFAAGKDWMFISNPIPDKEIDVRTSGNMWIDPAFSARISREGVWNVVSDLPGLAGTR